VAIWAHTPGIIVYQMANVNTLGGLSSYISKKDGFLIGTVIPDREQIIGLSMSVGYVAGNIPSD